MTERGRVPLAVWWTGARPRTLGAGVVPVLVGTAAAGQASAWKTVAALVVALGLQVGVNYANDYADGVSGVDTGQRVGPHRLVASGLATPEAVAGAAAACLGVAVAVGLALVLTSSPALLLVGAAALAGALLYSSGPHPYAGLGLGEVAVFIFFGLVGTCGTAYVQAGRVPAAAWVAAVPVGLLAVAILVANNLRDLGTDAAAGKRTLAVRIGDPATRNLYRVVVVGAFLVPPLGVAADALPAATLVTLATAPLALRPLRGIGKGQGRELVAVLTGTAALHLAFGLLLAAALWLA